MILFSSLAILQEVSPCVWTYWALWPSTQCHGMFPASNGIREGSDLGLIPDVELECVKSKLCRVGWKEVKTTTSLGSVKNFQIIHLLKRFCLVPHTNILLRGLELGNQHSANREYQGVSFCTYKLLFPAKEMAYLHQIQANKKGGTDPLPPPYYLIGSLPGVDLKWHKILSLRKDGFIHV